MNCFMKISELHQRPLGVTSGCFSSGIQQKKLISGRECAMSILSALVLSRAPSASGSRRRDAPAITHQPDDVAGMSGGLGVHREPPEEGLMCELLWSDPQAPAGRSPSKRGVGVNAVCTALHLLQSWSLHTE